jgi:hypothetical protein
MTRQFPPFNFNHCSLLALNSAAPLPTTDDMKSAPSGLLGRENDLEKTPHRFRDR